MVEKTLKASVVVATYRTAEEALDRIISSLDAQTLPHDQWEAIFVDDGSPDDTVQRLLARARTRPWMRVERIENSGWPCRPRNVGTDLATGEYIAYMDHDDALYPNALRDGYEFAVRTHADALNGKEARTSDIGWALDQFDGDHAQVLAPAFAFALSPTNPHKLYRRDFLVEHGIRFREGRRVLWEDIFFNVLVAKHAKVIATLSSSPYYYWHNTSGSGSTTFRRSRVEWWRSLSEVCAAIEGDLADPRLEAQRKALLTHQYRSRLLGAFNKHFGDRPPEERQMIVAQARAMQTEFFPEEHDELLNTSQRLRALLLRRGHPHGLEQLTRDDPTIPGNAHITAVEWSSDGSLTVCARAKWADKAGNRHRLTRDGDRIRKDLPRGYSRIFRNADLDVTEEVAGATLDFGVRDVQSRVSWLFPSKSSSSVTADGAVTFDVDGEGRLDPARGAMGNPLTPGRWELTTRCTLAGVNNHRMAQGKVRPAVFRSAGGNLSGVYTRADDVVVVDIDVLRVPLSALVTPTGVVGRSGDRTSLGVHGMTGNAGVVETTIEFEVPPTRRSRVGSIVRRVLQRRAAPATRQRTPATITLNASGAARLTATLPKKCVVFMGSRDPDGAPAYLLDGDRGLIRPARVQPLRRGLSARSRSKTRS